MSRGRHYPHHLPIDLHHSSPIHILVVIESGSKYRCKPALSNGLERLQDLWQTTCESYQKRMDACISCIFPLNEGTIFVGFQYLPIKRGVEEFLWPSLRILRNHPKGDSSGIS